MSDEKTLLKMRKKLYSKYEIILEDGKMTAKVSEGKITLKNKHGYHDFNFIKSKPETIKQLIKGLEEVLEIEEDYE